MENRLKSLIEGNIEANRTSWAMERKKQGRKVIGVMSSYVPEEVIHAAGMLPWRITGTYQESLVHARLYRAESSDGYCSAVLESLLSGELDFLDGIITTDQDHDLVRLWDMIVYLKKSSYCYIMHIPFMDSEIAIRFMTNEITKLIRSLEDFWGVKITENSLLSSIDTYNQMRSLLSRMYELRKREIPPLSGAEVLGITTAATVMPKEDFNQELLMLLPYLEKRQTNVKQVHPRLLVSSDKLDNPAYIDLVEGGCLVAMDDMDTGSRYFIQTVDTTLQEPAYALARRYLTRHAGPSRISWDRQVKQIIKWVKEYNTDGVLSLPLYWDYPQQYNIPWLSEKLKEAGILHMSLSRQYHLANVGQLRTRTEAFLEMLSAKRTDLAPI